MVVPRDVCDELSLKSVICGKHMYIVIQTNFDSNVDVCNIKFENPTVDFGYFK